MRFLSSFVFRRLTNMRYRACRSVTRAKGSPNQPWRRFSTKLLLIMLLGLVFMAGDCAPPSGRQQGFFPGLRGVTIPEFPPADGLLLWLARGASDDSEATASPGRGGTGPGAPGE